MTSSTDSRCPRPTSDSAPREQDQPYEELIRPYHHELLAHCYRLVGSWEDAEDALQEALTRAWCGLSRFQGQSSIRTWLYKVTTNTCLNVVAGRPRRRIPEDLPMTAEDHNQSAPQPIWIEPCPDHLINLPEGLATPEARYEQRETLELAFIAAFQLLPPRQRATLILRDVLGFSAQESAELLESTVASVNSALQRARTTVDRHRPEFSQQATLRALPDEQLQRVISNYVKALEEADVDGLLGMLTDDATWSMPPSPNWYGGRQDVRQFLLEGPLRVSWRHLPTYANGQLAVACYLWDEPTGRYAAFCIDVLSVHGPKISAVTAFIGEKFFAQFHLPMTL